MGAWVCACVRACVAMRCTMYMCIEHARNAHAPAHALARLSRYIQVTDAKSTGPDWSNKYIHDLLSASYPATPLGSRGIHSNNKVSIDRVFVGIRGNKYRSDPIHLKIISGNITEEDLKWEITSAPPNTLMLSGMHGYVQGTLSATPGLYSYNVRARVWLKPKMRNCKDPARILLVSICFWYGILTC